MFSAITFYWGNDDNLYRYVKDTLEYTDDIVIGYIDLFGYIPEIAGATIIPIKHDFLLKMGHSEVLNRLDIACKYDWAFHAAVGKRITGFKYSRLDAPSNIAGFASTEKGKGGAWSNLHHRGRAEWFKAVHEVIVPKPGFHLSMEPIVEWERTDYTYDNEDQEWICKMYRQMSRTKWVALEDIDPHPARALAISKYAEHFDAYDMDREDLIDYILSHDLEATM